MFKNSERENRKFAKKIKKEIINVINIVLENFGKGRKNERE